MSQLARSLGAISSISRPVDLRYASNRFVVFWMAVSFVIALAAWVANDEPVADAARGALTIAIGVFLAWALGRELDPDHPATARWAGMLALLFAAVLGAPSLLAAAVVMLTVRVLARTSGRAPTLLDLVVITAGGVLAAGTLAGAVAALVLATALVLDLRHDEPPAPGPTAAAAIAIVVGGTIRLLAADPLEWARPDVEELIIGALVLVGLFGGPSTPLRSVGDLTDEPLDEQRLAVARRLALVAVPVALLIGGQDEVVRLSPVIAGVTGMGLNNVLRARRKARADWTP